MFAIPKGPWCLSYQKGIDVCYTKGHWMTSIKILTKQLLTSQTCYGFSNDFDVKIKKIRNDL